MSSYYQRWQTPDIEATVLQFMFEAVPEGTQFFVFCLQIMILNK